MLQKERQEKSVLLGIMTKASVSRSILDTAGQQSHFSTLEWGLTVNGEYKVLKTKEQIHDCALETSLRWCCPLSVSVPCQEMEMPFVLRLRTNVGIIRYEYATSTLKRGF